MVNLGLVLGIPYDPLTLPEVNCKNRSMMPQVMLSVAPITKKSFWRKKLMHTIQNFRHLLGVIQCVSHEKEKDFCMLTYFLDCFHCLATEKRSISGLWSTHPGWHITFAASVGKLLPNAFCNSRVSLNFSMLIQHHGQRTQACTYAHMYLWTLTCSLARFNLPQHWLYSESHSLLNVCSLSVDYLSVT